MGMHLKKSIASYGVTIWQFILETAQGGFSLDITGLTEGGVLPGGSLVSYDESTRVAKVIKTATVQANAANNAVNIRVAKGHLFKVGDNVSRVIGGAAYPITAISTTDPGYDQITVGTTLGVALTAGDGLFQSTASGATASATLALRGLTKEDYPIESHTDIAVVIRGTVYARRIPAVAAELRDKLGLLIFSESF
jgi:hypothetical protein